MHEVLTFPSTSLVIDSDKALARDQVHLLNELPSRLQNVKDLPNAPISNGKGKGSLLCWHGGIVNEMIGCSGGIQECSSCQCVIYQFWAGGKACHELTRGLPVLVPASILITGASTPTCGGPMGNGSVGYLYPCL